jgi:hypothetical protein
VPAQRFLASSRDAYVACHERRGYVHFLKIDARWREVAKESLTWVEDA